MAKKKSKKGSSHGKKSESTPRDVPSTQGGPRQGHGSITGQASSNDSAPQTPRNLSGTPADTEAIRTPPYQPHSIATPSHHNLPPPATQAPPPPAQPQTQAPPPAQRQAQTASSSTSASQDRNTNSSTSKVSQSPSPSTPTSQPVHRSDSRSTPTPPTSASSKAPLPDATKKDESSKATPTDELPRFNSGSPYENPNTTPSQSKFKSKVWGWIPKRKSVNVMFGRTAMVVTSVGYFATKWEIISIIVSLLSIIQAINVCQVQLSTPEGNVNPLTTKTTKNFFRLAGSWIFGILNHTCMFINLIDFAVGHRLYFVKWKFAERDVANQERIEDEESKVGGLTGSLANHNLNEAFPPLAHHASQVKNHSRIILVLSLVLGAALTGVQSKHGVYIPQYRAHMFTFCDIIFRCFHQKRLSEFELKLIVSQMKNAEDFVGKADMSDDAKEHLDDFVKLMSVLGPAERKKMLSEYKAVSVRWDEGRGSVPSSAESTGVDEGSGEGDSSAEQRKKVQSVK